tara:strand:- start:605 stop:1714 length:1110 start_codon:yes stop_codon:yes gene_type:complete
MEVSCFLIDPGCLGVKDAWYEIHEPDLDALKERYFEDGCIEKSAAWGRHFVESAVAYAKKLGFKPHRDYKKATRVFGGIQTKDCSEDFSFGRNGKPFYFQSSKEDAATARKIINQLKAKCGDDGFHFIVEYSVEADPVTTQVEQCLEWAESGRIEDAFVKLKPLVKKHPDHAKVLYGWGLLHILDGDRLAAIRYLRMALEQDPEDQYAWYNLSVCYREEEQFGRAFEANCKVIEFGDENDAFWENAQEINRVLTECAHESELSIEDYISSHISFDLGVEAMAASQFEPALGHFRTAVQKNPRSHQGHGNMGTCLLQLGRPDEARKALQSSLDIDPDYKPALQNMKLLKKAKTDKPLSKEVFIHNFTRDK